VERLTVYRHFPDERALFTACTSHYLALKPSARPKRMEKISQAERRLQHRVDCDLRVSPAHRTDVHSGHQGLEEIPVLREVMAPFFAYWERVHEILCAPWKGLRPPAHTSASLRPPRDQFSNLAILGAGTEVERC
jgi:AcrR family transcriptional regulator